MLFAIRHNIDDNTWSALIIDEQTWVVLREKRFPLDLTAMVHLNRWVRKYGKRGHLGPPTEI